MGLGGLTKNDEELCKMPSLERANLISTASTDERLHRPHKISIYVTLDASKFLLLIDLMKKATSALVVVVDLIASDKSKTRIANIYQAGNW